MASILRISDRDFSSEELLDLLFDLELLPLLIRRYIERSISSSFKPTEEEQVLFQSKFLLKRNIKDLSSLNAWLVSNDISEPQLSKQIYHALQIKKFKHNKFSSQVDSIFLDKKSKLDKVMYSLLRARSRSKSFELYTRIIEQEATLSELASEYSEGVESQVNGLIGPLELGDINLSIAERLRISNQGQLWEPFEVDGWWVILRLEKFLPCKLDDNMRERIIDEMYNKWLHETVKENLSQILEKNPHFSKYLTPSKAVQKDEDSTSLNPPLLRRMFDKLPFNLPL